MESASFDNLYSYRERKNKGNIENFFTELIHLMLDISPKFKDLYLKFLEVNVINSDEIKIATQYTSKLSNDSPDKQIPDLVILKLSKDNNNSLPFIVCEHKIDSKIDLDQIKDYQETFDQCNNFRLITPNKPYTKKLQHTQNFEHIYWSDLFKILNNGYFQGDFLKYSDYNEYLKQNKENYNIENCIIFHFLDFMYWKNLIKLEQSYFDYLKTRHGGFKLFLKKIKEGLNNYKNIGNQLKERYKHPRPSDLMTFIDSSTIRVGSVKKKVWYGIYLNDDNYLVQYKYFKKKEFKENHNISIDTESFINSVDAIQDFYFLIKNELINIYRDIKEEIIDDDIKFYLNKNEGDFPETKSNIITVKYHLKKDRESYYYYFCIVPVDSGIFFGYNDKNFTLKDYDFTEFDQKLKTLLLNKK